MAASLTTTLTPRSERRIREQGADLEASEEVRASRRSWRERAKKLRRRVEKLMSEMVGSGRSVRIRRVEKVGAEIWEICIRAKKNGDSLIGTAEVGCVSEIVKHERLVDDRFFLICKGQERFRITKIVRTKPYLVASVSWLEDKPSSDGAPEDLEALAGDVEGYMRDVIRLNNRLSGVCLLT